MVKHKIALASLVAGCLFVGMIVLNADSTRPAGSAADGRPLASDVNIVSANSPQANPATKPQVTELRREVNTEPFKAVNDAASFQVEAGEKPGDRAELPGGMLDEAEAERIKAEIEAAERTADADAENEIAVESPSPEELRALAEEEAARYEEELRVQAQAARDLMTQGQSLPETEKHRLSAYLEDAVDRGNRDGLDNVGGPDGSNYFFVDNVAPDTATYSWIELRGDPLATWINSWTSMDDGRSSSNYPIGFSFPFYGAFYDSFNVATNGFIQFLTTATSLSNSCLPQSIVAGPAIFPYWDDLHLQRGGISTGIDVVGFRNFGTYTVIEFDSIGPYSTSCTGSSMKFQAILYSNGKIKLQYNLLNIVNSVCQNTQTIGIQSNGAAGSDALNYVCNTTGIQPTQGLAIWFYRYFYEHDFSTTTLLSPTGLYAPNAVVNVQARFTNFGTTAEGSPVKYIFNGGPVQTGTTNVLPHLGTQDFTFATPITLPTASGDYPLTIWTDLATDNLRANDTLHAIVVVFEGGDCASAITLTGAGPDSAMYNNCGAGDNSPGQPCGASGQDMVFRIVVPNGSQVVFWQTSNTITSRHTLRWGGSCPGDNFIDCSTTEAKKMRFVNHTGTAQDAYLTIGNTTAPGTCGNFILAWEITSCTPYGVPFIDGFEGFTAPVLPNCWSIAQAFPLTLTTSPLWENYTTTPRTGVNCASVLGASVGNDDWLFSPGISLNGGATYVVDFWWRATSATVPESLEVKAGTANIPSAMTLTIMPMDTLKTTAYVQKIFNFTPPSTGVYYIGWHNVTMRSAGRTRIDDVQIYPSGACSAPDVTVNAAIGQDSTLLTALVTGGSGGPPEFQWFTGLDCLEANRIPGARSQTFYAPTSGVYSCRAWIIDSLNCADCDSAYATVIDCSVPSPLPFAEGFEATSGTSFPPCWSVVTYDSDTRLWVTSTTQPRTGLRAAYIQYSSSGVIPNDWLFTPRFALTGGSQYVLDFWWREYLTSSTYYDSLEVLLTTAPNNSSVVATIVPIFRANVTTYQNSVTIFNAPATGNYYVAFRYTGGDNDGGVRIDDISLYAGGTCTPPTVSVADSAGIGTVTMFCNAVGGSGGPIQYQWYTGQTCTPANRIVGATSATYNTTVSGEFACLAWRYDSLLCSGCDWGTATVSPAPPGYDCSNPIVLTTTSEDSAQYNNCNMGNNSPGQSCGNSINDMVFRMQVPNGYTASIYQYYNNFDSRHSLRWGGACPGDNLVGCVDDPDYTQYSWMNCTGSTQNVYFVVGYYSTSNICGDFRLRWSLTPNPPWPCTEITCTPTVTESGANGGCGVDSMFNTITCGSVIAGNVFATTSLRDVDVFELVLTDSANLTITAVVEFDAQLQVRWDGDPNCPDDFLASIDSNPTCGTETRTIYQVPPGRVHISIVSPFVETCGPRDYCMTVTCAPPSPEPGETCAGPYIMTPPAANDSVVASGTTVGRVGDCVDSCDFASSAPDVFYSLTLTSCRKITMKLEDTGSSGDMHISVYEAGQCCLNALLCNDDRNNFDTLAFEAAGQRPAYSLASFVGGELPAGTYLIRVSRYGSSTTGNYRLVVFDNGPCPACVITCQGQDVIEAAESRYDQTFYMTDPDGGCNSTPPVFGAVNCGQTVCGVGFTYQRRANSANWRDTDWYQFTTTQRGLVRLTVNAGFPATFAVMDVSNCASPVVLFGATAAACVETQVGDTINAGTYAMVVLPTSYVGNPTPTRYRATLYCQPPCVEPTALTSYLINADGGATANDIQLRWLSQAGFPGTYKIYMNNNLEDFPGGAGWTVLTGNIPPNTTPPYVTTYNHLNVVTTSGRKFYVVVGECN